MLLFVPYDLTHPSNKILNSVKLFVVVVAVVIVKWYFLIIDCFHLLYLCVIENKINHPSTYENFLFARKILFLLNWNGLSSEMFRIKKLFAIKFIRRNAICIKCLFNNTFISKKILVFHSSPLTVRCGSIRLCFWNVAYDLFTFLMNHYNIVEITKLFVIRLVTMWTQ